MTSIFSRPLFLQRLLHKLILCLNVGVFFLPAVVLAANVHQVRLWRAPDNTRLVFDLSEPTEHKLLNLSGEKGNAQRIVVILPKAQFSANTSQLKLGNTPIASLQVEHKGSDIELIIDLKAHVRPKSFLLPANNQYGERLVLDLFDENSPSEVKAVKPANNGMRDIVIAVDAGHGGEDPGARGPGGIYEKDITLAIAKELAQHINDTPGYSAFLTRTGDYYVSLRGRTQIARDKGADFFVSIHADAFKDSSAQGAGVFALSQRGATSETARWLAQTENDADLVGGVNLADKDPVLQGVLLDLSMTSTVATSLDAGDDVLREMKKITRMHRGFVEQAGFVVLKNPDIPSLLIETGFITNREEARKLSSASYRSKMAQSIFNGINKHFREKPPMDTALAAARGGKVKRTIDKTPVATTTQPVDAMEKLLAAKKKSRTSVSSVTKPKASAVKSNVSVKSSSTKYLVKKGDTLSAIASRNKISMAALRDYNHLNDMNVRVGQTLYIPQSNAR
jgi:N-acetylmuramoyl-L-alanine amidase